MYWLWKNVKSEYKGLFHYRRYLSLKKEKRTNIKELDYKEEDILNFFKEYDILVPEKIGSSKNSLEEEYKKSHIAHDWDTTKEVIKELYPDYYSIALEEFNQRKFYPLNMLIARNKIFDGYCEWLFNILFEVEKRIEISTDSYQARVFGFLSERLLGIYIKKHNLKVKTLKVMSIEENGNIYIEDCKFIRSIKKRVKKLKELF